MPSPHRTVYRLQYAGEQRIPLGAVGSRAACLAVVAFAVFTSSFATAQALRVARSGAADSVQARFQEGIGLYREGQYEAAVQVFSEVLRAQPDHPTARLYLQSAETKMDRQRAGRGRVDLSWVGEQTDGTSASKAAGTAAHGEPDLAAANDPEAIRQRADEYYKEALRLYKKKEFAEAKAKLQRVAALVPDHAQANDLFARILSEEQSSLARAEQEKAQQVQEEQARQAAIAQEQQRRQVAEHLRQAEKLRARQQFEQARAAIDAALELDPHSDAARKEMDRLAAQQAQAQQEAEQQQLRLAQAAAEGQTAARIEQLLADAEAARKDGRLEEAARLLEEAAGLAPDNRDITRARRRLESSAAEATKTAAKAAAEATKVAAKVEEKEREMRVQELLVQSRAQTSAGQFDDARATLTRALEIDPQNRAAQRQLAAIDKAQADAARQAEKAQAAAEAVRLAQEQQAREQEIRDLVAAAQAAIDQGDFDTARAKLEQAQGLAPDARAIRTTRANLDKAEAKAQKIQQQAAEAAARAEREAADAAARKRERVEREAAEAAARTEREAADAAARERERVEREAAEAAARAEAEAAEAQERAQAEARRVADETQAAAAAEARQRAQVNQLIIDGDRAMEYGNFEAAIDKYRQAAELNPGNRAVSRKLARARSALQEARTTASDVVERTETTPAAGASMTTVESRVDARFERAKALFESGDLQGALTEFRAVLELQPDHPTALLYIERIQSQMGAATTPAKTARPQDQQAAKAEGTPATGNEAAALARGMAYFHAGQLDEAEVEFQNALSINPNSTEAQSFLQKIASERATIAAQSAKAEEAAAAAASAEARQSASALTEQGLQAYMEGRIIDAVEAWRKALAADPSNETVRTYLDGTQDEYEQALRTRDEKKQVADQEQRYADRMKEPNITIELRNTEIDEVLNILGVLSGFNIIAGDGVEGKITLNVKEKSLEEVLNLMLSRYGYGWKREGNDIFVLPAHQVRTFQLDEDACRKLQRILEDPNLVADANDPTKSDRSRALQVLLYGETGRSPVEGRFIRLNENTCTLVVKDSSDNIRLVEDFLKNIPPLVATKEPLLNRQYVLNPETAEKVYNLLNLVLYGEKNIPPSDARGRMLLLDEDTNILVVKDTAENIASIEQILNDQRLLDRLRTEDLIAKAFRVCPPEDLEDTAPARTRCEARVAQTVQILEAMLYGRGGKQEAYAQGRMMFSDMEEGMIHVIDTHANMKKVENYLRGGTGERLIHPIPIQHADPFYVARFIGQFLLGLDEGGRRVYISESYQGGGGGRTASGRSGGTTGAASANFITPTQRGSREASTARFGLPVQQLELELEDGAYLMVEPNSSSLLVLCSEGPMLDRIIEMVDILDIRPRQLEIEARLIEVDLQEARDAGATFSLNMREGLENIGNIGDILEWPAKFNYAEGKTAFTWQSIGGKSFVDIVFQFLSTLKSTEVLSAPKLISSSAPDFVPAIYLVTQEPFVSNVDYVSTGTTGQDVLPRIVLNYETIPVGLQLSVYPVITGDDHIYLDVYPRLSVVTGRLPVVLDPSIIAALAAINFPNLESIGVPIVDERWTFNSAVLNDGETMILGGLTVDRLLETTRRTPGLARIPVFGYLFKQHSKETRKQALLIFVTANILKS